MREAVGPGRRCGVDANGAWSVDEAAEAIAELARLDLELVEQPCATLDELAAVRARVEVPVGADESISTPADVLRAAELAACDAVNVKLSPAAASGPPARPSAPRARRAWPAWLSSTLDGPWGIAAALQLASSEGLGAGLRPGHAAPVRRRGGARAAGAGQRPDGRAARARARRGRLRRRAVRGAGRGNPLAARHRLGLLQVGGVAGVLHHRGAPVGHGARDPRRRVGVALVALARQRPARAATERAGAPHRLQRSLARGAQRQRQVRAGPGPGDRAAGPRPARRTGRRTAAGAPRPRRSRRSAGSPSSRPASRRPARRSSRVDRRLDPRRGADRDQPRIGGRARAAPRAAPAGRPSE